ncbi:MAG: glutamine synthetase [Candidatus Dadabacteria bacterium]|nr:MAG: glutamine synthetase [Candidatus Dadabacteria bacterium]
MYGRLVGKRITGHFFVSHIAAGGMECCDYLLACDMEMDPVAGYRIASWDKGYGDMHAVPDLSTLRVASWLERTAIVLCDLFRSRGADPIEVAPRTILRRQLDRAARRGLVVKAGSELEFFLLKQSYEEARARHFVGLEPLGWYVEDYHALQGTREEPIVGRIRRAMDASGVPVEFSKGEWGPGQHEINLRYAEMLEMADRHVLYKHAAKEIAIEAGRALTFMAKLDERWAGNSLHIHTSLWDSSGERALFAEREEGGYPEIFEHYLAGLLAHARELTLWFAPNVNSYKRFVAGSFAPTAVAWAVDNRTAGFRVVGRGDSLRVECRIPGADANPYLAMAAIVAAGLDGIDRKLELPPPVEGNAYECRTAPRVPGTLEEALELFRGSDFTEAAFGAEVVAHYARFAEVELEKFRGAVTGWERERFLERG